MDGMTLGAKANCCATPCLVHDIRRQTANCLSCGRLWRDWDLVMGPPEIITDPYRTISRYGFPRLITEATCP